MPDPARPGQCARRPADPHFPERRRPPGVTELTCGLHRKAMRVTGSGWRSRCAGPVGSTARRRRRASRGCGRARPRRAASTGSWPTRNTASSAPIAKARAVELQVAAQQVLVEARVVLLGRRHHVGLVVQGALAQREPDREDVLLLAPKPHEPAPLARLAVAVDRGHHRVGRPAARPATASICPIWSSASSGRRADHRGRTRQLRVACQLGRPRRVRRNPRAAWVRSA